MTLQVKIINEGNQPEDTAVLKGIKEYPKSDPASERRSGGISGNTQDVVTLGQGEEIVVYPDCGHFDDFQAVYIKGKH